LNNNQKVKNKYIIHYKYKNSSENVNKLNILLSDVVDIKSQLKISNDLVADNILQENINDKHINN
jgi:hypothetical protein